LSYISTFVPSQVMSNVHFLSNINGVLLCLIL
jgi:hypothetical protein